MEKYGHQAKGSAHTCASLVRRLAEEIIAGQTTEIRAMKDRLSILSQRSDPDPGDFPAIGGTRGNGRKDRRD